MPKCDFNKHLWVAASEQEMYWPDILDLSKTNN